MTGAAARFTLTALAPLAAFALCGAVASPGDGGLRTLAGSGAWGDADGPAASATFMLPTGLAYAPDGALYIADQGAQRIRKLEAGVVSTVAGSGDDVRDDGTVAGGYRDGPAPSARFDAPVSLAVEAGGALLVVDRRNHCVRRIAAGVVTTEAGSPARPFAADGARDRAAFALPTAIALDASGTPYVADYGAGLRSIARDGSVTTLPLPPATATTFVGLAATGTPPNVVLFATRDDGTVLRYALATRAVLTFPALTREERHVRPWGIAALDAEHALVSDLAHDVVRLYGTVGAPGSATLDAPVVAGTAFARGVAEAGFADGLPPIARLALPDALAVRGNELAIADGAARRIREIAVPALRAHAGGERVLFAADPAAFAQTAWPGSLPGRLAAALRGDVEATTLDGLAAALSDGARFDRIVVLLDPAAFTPATATLLAAVRARAARSGARLVAELAERGPCIDVSESPALSATAGAGPCSDDAARRALARAGIAFDSLDADLRAYERAPGRLPLFETASARFTDAGMSALAPLIARRLTTR